MRQADAYETALKRVGWILGGTFLAVVAFSLGSGFNMGWSASFHRGMAMRLQSR